MSYQTTEKMLRSYKATQRVATEERGLDRCVNRFWIRLPVNITQWENTNKQKI